MPPLDCDEEAAANLPPKHLYYPVVKLQDSGLTTSVGGHKIRWDRRKRDFQDGVEVTPDEDSPTMTDLLESENTEKFSVENQTQ